MIDPRRLRELHKLADTLGIKTVGAIDWRLLDQALVTPSFSQVFNNDQMEFLGDSVLRLVVTLFITEGFSDRSLGEMAALRSSLVSDQTLAAIAEIYGLDSYMVMSPAARADLNGRQSYLADALEAVLAALYLSTRDFSLICPWLHPHLARIANQLFAQPALGNFKEALQELTQARWKSLPEYRMRELDPVAHLFQAEVWLNGCCWGRGEGKNIKMAQQAAAAVALIELQASLP